MINLNIHLQEEFKLSNQIIQRRVDREENSLANHLKSIVSDSKFIDEISSYYPKYPLVANLRCGAWYSSRFEHSCYFRSTDGHYGNWRFSLTRLNLNIIDLLLQYNGCLIVDSTKRGKKFPDSFSRTIPIWISVINRCMLKLKHQEQQDKDINEDEWNELYTPKWISESERDQMMKMVDQYLHLLMEHSETLNLKGYSQRLYKPLRPLWLSVETQPTSLDFINDQDQPQELDFYPLYLLSCSDFRDHNRPFRAYIQGAGDDEENWSLGLTPRIFWSNHSEIMSQSNDNELEMFVQNLVKNDKKMKDIIIINSNDHNQENIETKVSTDFIEIENSIITISSSKELLNIWNRFDLIINCSLLDYFENHNDDKVKNNYLFVSMKDGKSAKTDLIANLQRCEQWIQSKLSTDNNNNSTKKILIHSSNELSNCVCILTVLLSKMSSLIIKDLSKFDSIVSSNSKKLTKSDITKIYLFIEKQSPSSLPHKTIRNAINNYLLSNLSFK